MASPGHVRIAVNIKSGNEPLPTEMTIATTLAEQLGINVLLRGQNVPGGDALLTLVTGKRARAEFKTLHASNARAFERNVREASRQTGVFPGIVVLDARIVETSAVDAEAFLARALGLVAPRRPKLQAAMVITQERILWRSLERS